MLSCYGCLKKTILMEGIDLQRLTRQDKDQAKKGLPPQRYEAYMVYVDEDVSIAMKIKKKLEDKGAMICTKCDLLGGLTIEHAAVRTLISKRCHFLIVVLSQAFLVDRKNEYFVSIGELISLTNKNRKLIPCIFETTLELPASLSLYVALRYRESDMQHNARFFSQLQKAMEQAKKAIDIIEDFNLSLPPSPPPKKRRWLELPFKRNKNRKINVTSIETSVTLAKKELNIIEDSKLSLPPSPTPKKRRWLKLAFKKIKKKSV